MDIKQKYREETNLEPYFDLVGNYVCYTKEYVKWLEEQLRLHGVGSCLSDVSTFTIGDETGDNKIQLEVPKDSKQKYTIGWNNGSYKFTVED